MKKAELTAIVAEKAGNGYYLAETVRGIFEEYYRLKELRQNPDWRELIIAEENATEAVENTDENTAETVDDVSLNTEAQQNVQQQLQQEDTP